MKPKRNLVLHPFCLAAYPVLFLLAHNLESTFLEEAYLPLAVSLFSAMTLFLLLWLILRNPSKSGLITSLCFIFFFTYIPVYRAVKGFKLGGFLFGRHCFMLLFYGVAFLLVLYLILRMREHSNLVNLTKILNLGSAVLIFFSLAQIAFYTFFSGQYSRVGKVKNQTPNRKAIIGYEKLPNIYYIILDGYAREDTLKKRFGYDNSDFLTFLKEKGFYIVSKSRPNYRSTTFSLSSSLNMNYLDELMKELGTEKLDGSQIRELIKNNKVRIFLSKFGYKFVVFESGWKPTNIENADIYMSKTGFNPSEFQSVLLDMTPVPLAMKILAKLEKQADFGKKESESSFQYDIHRSRVLYAFDHLPRTTKFKEPLFVLAHIISPHPPFVFDDEGKPVDPDYSYRLADGGAFPGTKNEYIEGYKKQLIFVNKKVKVLVEELISKSPRPVIIVIQSDHGPGSQNEERFANFSCYFFPDGNYKRLYPTVTPVNTFRIILSQYFGADYQPIRDRNYFTPYYPPFESSKAKDITEELK